MARGNIQTYQRSVLPTANPGPVIPSGRSGLATGLDAAADAFQGYARVQGQYEAVKRQKDEEDANAAVTKASAQSMLDLGTTITDLELNAPPGGAGHTQAVTKAIDEYAEKLTDGTTSPYAKERLSEFFLKYKAQQVPQAMGFEATARVDKRVGDMSSSIDLYRNAVSSNPAQFETALTSLEAGIDGMNVPAGKKDALLKMAREGLSASAIGAQIDRDPQGTLAQLRGGDWDTYVDPNQKVAFINGAESEIKRREAEAKSAAREARMEAQVGISLTYQDAIAEAQATGKQSSVTEAEILNNFPDKTGQKMVQDLRLATTMGQDNIAIRGQPRIDDQAMLAELEPKAGQDDFAQAQKRYNAAVDSVARKDAALTKDPAGYVMQTNQAVSNAWKDANSDMPPEKQAEAAKRAVALTKQAQSDMGVPDYAIKTMPSQQADALAKSITDPSVSADEVSARVSSIQNIYGGQGIAEVVSSGAPSTTFGIAFADAPGMAQWRSRLVEYQKLPTKERDELISKSGFKKTEVEEAVTGQIGPLLQTMPSSAAVPYIDSVQAVAEYNVIKRGMAPKDAAQDAYKVFDDAYSFQGTYRVPKTYEADTVSNGLQGIIQNADKLNITPPGSAIPGLSPEFAKGEAEKALRGGGFRWQNTADGKGVMLLWDDLNPVMVDQKPFTVTWEDVVANTYGKPRQRTRADVVKGN